MAEEGGAEQLMMFTKCGLAEVEELIPEETKGAAQEEGYQRFHFRGQSYFTPYRIGFGCGSRYVCLCPGCQRVYAAGYCLHTEPIGSPEDLETETVIGDPVYWEGGGYFTSYVAFQMGDATVAAASANGLTGELVKDILRYTGG